MIRPLVVSAAVLLGTVLFTGACGDTVHNNEGECSLQATVDPASGCDAAKESYYTCPGARQPDSDSGIACTHSKVNGGFCCPQPTAAGNGSQTGQIVDFFDATKGVAGATVDFGNGLTTTTDSNGKYSLQILQNTPFYMSITAPNYTQLLEQEWFLTGDYDNKTTALVSASINAAVSSGLDGYDATKSALGIGVYPGGGCASNAGSVIAIDPPTAGKLIYFHGGASPTPNPAGTSVEDSAINPSALIYNLDASAPLPTITVTPPTSCSVAAYPHTIGNVTYTGKFKLLPGGTNGQAFFRMFLEK